MAPKQSRPLLVIGMILVLAVCIFGCGGFFLHSLVSNAFTKIERVETAEHINGLVLSAQLDLETGLRGYVNTGDPEFLEPYNSALNRIDPDCDKLRVALREAGLPDYVAKVDDAQRSSLEWRAFTKRFIQTSSPRRLLSTITISQQKQAKALLDRFRSDIDPIDYALSEKRLSTANSARESVDRIALFVTFVVISVGLVGYAIMGVQYELAQRLELARRTSEEERRRLDDLRIALDTERRIADKLQDALSQRPLPVLPAVHFSAMYMPATEEAKVGGDWYDAIELSPDRALFIIGDVAGHGLDAAVGMSRARQEFIGSALRKSDPADILQRVNAELVREESPMVTGVCGMADASRYEFIFATAGHPPPVLIEPGRAPRLLACGGLPLGVVDNAEYKTYTIQTVPGAILVLYTDGAIEHSHSVLEGEQLLLEAAAFAMDEESLDPATVIHRRIFAGREAGDDVAILTIGFATEENAGMKISVERQQSTISGSLRRRAEFTNAGVADDVQARHLYALPWIAPQRFVLPDRIAS